MTVEHLNYITDDKNKFYYEKAYYNAVRYGNGKDGMGDVITIGDALGSRRDIVSIDKKENKDKNGFDITLNLEA